MAVKNKGWQNKLLTQKRLPTGSYTCTPPVSIPSASAAKAFGAGLAPARAVTNGFVGWKLLLDHRQLAETTKNPGYPALKLRDILSYHGPNKFDIYSQIVVDEHVSEGRQRGPVDLRMGRLEVSG